MASASGAKSDKAAAEMGSPAAESATAEGGEHNMGAMAGDIVYLKTEMKRLKNIVETLSPGAALKSAGVPSNSSDNDMAASDAAVDDAIVVDEEKAIETPYLPSEALKSAGAPSNSTVDEIAGRNAAVDDAVVVDELETGGDESAAAPTAAAKKKKKKKKKKRAKAKGRGAKVWNWCHGNSTKITVVGSLAVVLLVSVTFGQGLLGDQFPSLRKGADPTRRLSGADTGAPPSNNAPEASDAVPAPPSAELPTRPLEPTSSSSLDGCLSDPNTCGCNHLGQADYRGSINVAKNGVACMRWDQFFIYLPKDYPDAGLEENFCRNPDTLYRGAGCVTIEGGWDYCDVPVCEVSHAPEASDATSTPSSAEQPISSIKPTTTSSAILTNDPTYWPTSLHPTSSSNSIELPSSEQPSDEDKDGDYDEDEDGVSSSLDGCLSDPNTCGCMHLGQADYRGSINKTENGFACKRWDQTFLEILQEYPDAGLEENFCRNPFGDGRAGCVTIEWDYEYCDVPICEASHAPKASDAMTTPPSSEQPSSSIKPAMALSVIPSISSVVPSTSLQPTSSSLDGCLNDPINCGCTNLGQTDYRGSVNVTKNGVACIRWDQTRYTKEYPNASLEENFCRNPDQDDSWIAWCFTTDDEDYEYCNVTICEASCNYADPKTCGCSILRQADYRGSISTTRSGYTCQRWDSQTPHTHDKIIPENHPSMGLEDNNYCRNPAGGPGGAWCHTIDNPNDSWEYCVVPYCEDPIMAAERSALLEIWDAANGKDWVNKWGSSMDSNEDYCEWHGVTCNNDMPPSIIELDLSKNGMTGTLSESIGNLRSLKRLDLRDNNIGGVIPTEIGDLLELEELDLSYNLFEGSAPRFSLEHRYRLVLLHLHDNELSGSVEAWVSDNLFGQSSFVADCGEPLMSCKHCTMCCNSQGLCTPNGETFVEKWGFKDFRDFTKQVFLSTVVGFSCAMALSSLLYDKYKSGISPRRMNRSTSGIHREEEYALKTIGKDSVYQFFLGVSWWGWAIALATIGAQIWVLLPFLEGSDPVNGADPDYSWQCPRDNLENKICSDTNGNNKDWQGWVLFGILTAAHILKDIINGSKMIILSGKLRNGGWSRVRYFFGGFCMLFITSFTLYVSAIYNKATATSNTELIVNSVIILFVITVDEYVYAILETMSPRGVEKMSSQVQEQGQETQQVSAAEKRNKEGLEELKQQNEELKENVERVESEMDDLRSQLDLLTQGRVDATVARATQGSEGDGASDESED